MMAAIRPGGVFEDPPVREPGLRNGVRAGRRAQPDALVHDDPQAVSLPMACSWAASRVTVSSSDTNITPLAYCGLQSRPFGSTGVAPRPTPLAIFSPALNRNPSSLTRFSPQRQYVFTRDYPDPVMPPCGERGA